MLGKTTRCWRRCKWLIYSSPLSIQALDNDYLASLNSHSLGADFSLCHISIRMRCHFYCVAKNSPLEDIASLYRKILKTLYVMKIKGKQAILVSESSGVGIGVGK